MFQGNEEFRKNTLKMIEDFIKLPEARTADVVPSIRVLLSQVYTFMQIDNYQQYLGDSLKLDNRELNILFRYAFEEQLRRNLKADMEALSKTQILKLLWPGYMHPIDEVIAVRQKEIAAEFNSGEQTGESMQRFFDMAMMFKALDKDAQKSKSLIEEEKKEEEKVPVKGVSKDQKTD